ncbi:ROK family transcriptional regulator [Neorhizobium petrolearium]|uniref:ROK family transcriptional regulator n=1 Tax=Neorhizobium petrolearium TaxID=515361 RepID=UPI003F15C78D
MASGNKPFRKSARPAGRAIEIAAADNENESTRLANIGLVLDTLRQYGPISRIEISEKLDLSRSTVTGITARLLKEGLIDFAKEPAAASADSNLARGRPRVGLTLNPKAAYAVGVRIAISQITVSVTDFVCDVIGSSVLPFRSARQAPEVVADVVEDAIRRAVIDCGLGLNDIKAICAGVPGVVDSNAGVCHWSPAFSREDVPFASLLTKRLGVPTVIENHTIPLATAETMFGSGQGIENCVVITLGHGVGLGIIINGEIYRGSHGFASELSHTKISEDGPLCECGQRGCLEAHIGFLGLLRQAGEETTGPISDDAGARQQKVMELIGKARDGNEHLQAIFRLMGTRLGRSLANLVGILDPARIIFSGPNIASSDLWLESMKEALFPNVRAPMENRLDFVLDERDDAFWARGAAALVLHQLYRSPLLLKLA